MGANAGSIKGAVAGYVASRATKAVARAILNFRGGKGDNCRFSKVKKERKVDTQSDQLRFCQQLKENKGWRIKKGKSKPTLEDPKTGNMVQKSIEKWEIEVYDRHENHIGVFKPSDGTFHPELAVKGRKMSK